MRLTTAFLLGSGVAYICAAQTLAPVPVPSDPYELVTGNGKAQAKDADRTQALGLLNHAKSFMRLHAATAPAHLLTVSFTSTGDANSTGTGELTELWIGLQNQRWTAKFGNFAMSRVNIRGEAFDERPVTLVPMRIHMLRNTIFWAAGTIEADAQFRSAPVEWNGRPATCVLVSDRKGAPATAARRWDESEYCIDDQSGLIQTLSFAPGNYTIYGYSKGQVFHGTPMPDRIVTYIAGAVAIDASLRMDEPDSSVSASNPTPEMLANGRPPSLQDPARRRFEIHNPQVGTEQVVMVNAQVGPTGTVAAEVCAASDLSLSDAAINFVKSMSFGWVDSQRQVYAEIVFTPASSPSPSARTAKVPTPQVTLEPYYLERATTAPMAEIEGNKEIVARRSDGATMRMASVGPGSTGVFSRDVNFPDGRHVTVYDSIKAKVTWPSASGAQIQFLRARMTEGPAECSMGGNATLLRHDQMEGQDVNVIQFSAGANRVTVWQVPKLGCEFLYDKAEAPARNGGGFRVNLEVKTTKLVVGEPEARLFEVAPDLAEMKPSEAQRKLWESMDLPMSAEEKATLMRQLERQGAEADRRYEVGKQ